MDFIICPNVTPEQLQLNCARAMGTIVGTIIGLIIVFAVLMCVFIRYLQKKVKPKLNNIKTHMKKFNTPPY
jgi:hypothetical protein